MHNPDWIRATVASLILAVLLRVGLHVPIFTTFVTLGIIHLLQVVMTQMKTGVTTLWEWIKSTRDVAIGVVIFLALRYMAAGLLHLYPIATFYEINSAEGLYGILPSNQVSKVILWELAFAFVAGYLTVAHIQGKTKLVRWIFVISLAILTLQLVFPSYTNKWPGRERVSTSLEESGVVGTAYHGLWAFLFGKPSPKPTPPATAPAVTAPEERRVAIVAPLPSVIDAVTPATLSLDFHFRIESDGPINIEYPGEEPVLYTPGVGFQQLPKPGSAGPKVFTDPKDPNGKVRFRIYPQPKPIR